MQDERPGRAVFDSIEALEGAAGTQVARSPWLLVTQAAIDDFARVTRDVQWIHVDVERARRESPYGTTIAHGFLTLSLLTPLIESAIEVRNVRFISGIPAGSEIRAIFTVQSVERLTGGARIAWLVEVHVRDAEKPALSAVWLSRTYAAHDETTLTSRA